jgi:hypothetical protein
MSKQTASKEKSKALFVAVIIVVVIIVLVVVELFVWSFLGYDVESSGSVFFAFDEPEKASLEDEFNKVKKDLLEDETFLHLEKFGEWPIIISELETDNSAPFELEVETPVLVDELVDPVTTLTVE